MGARKHDATHPRRAPAAGFAAWIPRGFARDALEERPVAPRPAGTLAETLAPAREVAEERAAATAGAAVIT